MLYRKTVFFVVVIGYKFDRLSSWVRIVRQQWRQGCGLNPVIILWILMQWFYTLSNAAMHSIGHTMTS